MRKSARKMGNRLTTLQNKEKNFTVFLSFMYNETYNKVALEIWVASTLVVFQMALKIWLFA